MLSDNVLSDSADLSECEWWIGDAVYTSITPRGSFLWGTAVLIEYPTTNRGLQKHAIASVGFSEETRRIWIGVLTLSGLSRRTAYESDKPYAIINLAGLSLCVAIAFGAYFLMRPIQSLMFLSTGNEEVSKLIGTQIFLPGCLYMYGYMVHFWPWDNREMVRRTDAAERKRITRRWFWLSVLAGSLVYVQILFWRQIDLEAKSIAITFGLIVSLIVGYDLGHRMATWERKKTKNP